MLKWILCLFIVVCLLLNVDAQRGGFQFGEPLGGSSNEFCEGRIQTLATGNSGPFDVTVANEIGTITNAFTLGGGQAIRRTILNVCPGRYFVNYVNRFGCDFTETVNVEGCESDGCCDQFDIRGRVNLGGCSLIHAVIQSLS